MPNIKGDRCRDELISVEESRVGDEKSNMKNDYGLVKGEGGGKRMMRIGGVFVEYSLGERAKKNSFHTRKKFHFSMTTRVRSQLAYLEDALFPICL
jgi:hypothetical protein